MAGRVDLGNVRGRQGATGKGIIKIEYIEASSNLESDRLRVYYSDHTPNSPSYSDFSVVKPVIPRTSTVSNSSEYAEYLPTNRAVYNALSERPTYNYVYSKSQTEDKIREYISKIEIAEVVTSLPTTNIETNRLYFLVKNADSDDGLNSTIDVFIRVNKGTSANPNYQWEQIDELEFNINNYYSKTQSDSRFAQKTHTHGNMTNDGKVGTSNNSNKNVVTDANGNITIEDKVLGGIELIATTNTSNEELAATSTTLSEVKTGTMILLKVINPFNRIQADCRLTLTLKNGEVFNRKLITHPDFPNYLRSDKVPPNTIFLMRYNGSVWDIIGQYNLATQSFRGLMSAEDKTKLDNLENSKQDSLISGTNIKTINGQSILGSGNLTINGGGSSSSGGQPQFFFGYYKNDAFYMNKNGVQYSGFPSTLDDLSLYIDKDTGNIYKYDTSSDPQSSPSYYQVFKNVDTDTTYDVATDDTDGLMSASDKSKLDNISYSQFTVRMNGIKVGHLTSVTLLGFKRFVKLSALGTGELSDKFAIHGSDAQIDPTPYIDLSTVKSVLTVNGTKFNVEANVVEVNNKPYLQISGDVPNIGEQSYWSLEIIGESSII